jgi:uncharacterized damage-inducible protein DinB
LKSFDVQPLPGYHPEIGLLLATLQESTREYRRFLEGLDDEGITFQARPAGHSIGGLLLHIAEVELYWIVQVGAGKRIPKGLLPDYSCSQSKGEWPPPPALPYSQYTSLLDNVREISLAAASEFQPDIRVIRKRWDAELSHRWILSHVIAHDSYHGGQAVLLRDLFDSTAR